MKTVIDKANTRGYFNHGWLKTYHTFSFADYYNPRRIHFGALRVLNDYTVAPGEGFGMIDACACTHYLNFTWGNGTFILYAVSMS